MTSGGTELQVWSPPGFCTVIQHICNHKQLKESLKSETLKMLMISNTLSLVYETDRCTEQFLSVTDSNINGLLLSWNPDLLIMTLRWRRIDRICQGMSRVLFFNPSCITSEVVIISADLLFFVTLKLKMLNILVICLVFFSRKYRCHKKEKSQVSLISQIFHLDILWIILNREQMESFA